MVAAVLLAAGGGSRFAGDSHKLRAPFRGQPLLCHAIAPIVEAGLDLFVVTGAVDVADLVPASATIVPNTDWEQGQATSVRAGIAAAAAAGHDAVVVGLGDQPFLTAEAWRSVASSDAPMAVATYDGRPGHPVRLAATVWGLLPEVGDEVGRVVRRSRPDLVREIPCPRGDASDIDTLEDLHRWS